MEERFQNDISRVKRLKLIGLIMFIVSIIFTIGTIFALYCGADSTFGLYLFFELLFIVIGIGIFIVEGKSIKDYEKSASFVKTGMKSVCQIIDIEISQNEERSIFGASYMKVRYENLVGESFTLCVCIKRELLAKVCIDMYIECYVKGNDCFVDVNNIVVVK